MKQNEAPRVTTIGWDLGGVHVKAVLVEGGRVREAVQAPCRLWRGLPALDETLAGLPDWARSEARHVVTMTGELTDCFPDRRAGVEALAAWTQSNLSGKTRIYAGRSGFILPDAAADAAADVASANWHATAVLVGAYRPDALLVDIGSTTADLIPIVAGAPAAQGYSDAERLEEGELVYSGAVRTALAALTRHAPWNGRRVALMAETFATTADVYRILGLLPDGADQQQSADLKGKSITESETRLARMIGRDRAEGTARQWRDLAAWFAEAQLANLHEAAALVTSRADLPGDAPVVTCGAGRFVGERLARRLARSSLDLRDLLADRLATEAARDGVSTCGPATAVALLAADRGN